MVKASPTVQTNTNGDEGFSVGMKLCMWGTSKSGKTRFACTFPKPMILVGSEDGTKSVSNGRKEKYKLPNGNAVYELMLHGKPTGIDFVKLTCCDELDEIAGHVKLGKLPYKAICLDHAGGFQSIALKEVLGLDQVPVTKSYGIADVGTWGICNMQCMERLNNLLSLADHKGTHIVIIAHDRSSKDDGKSSELIQPKVGPALTPALANWLEGACDYICQSMIRQRTDVQVMDGVPVPVIGKGVEYVMGVAAHSVYKRGFRVPDGPDGNPIELPEDGIVNPSYEKVAKLIRGEK